MSAICQTRFGVDSEDDTAIAIMMMRTIEQVNVGEIKFQDSLSCSISEFCYVHLVCTHYNAHTCRIYIAGKRIQHVDVECSIVACVLKVYSIPELRGCSAGCDTI